MTTQQFAARASSPRRPIEPLSTRISRFRLARGYSVGELARDAGIFAGTVRRLESGRRVDKRILAPIAATLGVPLCRLVCGEHDCVERACVQKRRDGDSVEPLRRRLWICGLIARPRRRVPTTFESVRLHGAPDSSRPALFTRALARFAQTQFSRCPAARWSARPFFGKTAPCVDPDPRTGIFR